jgi:hypothetical protein
MDKVAKALQLLQYNKLLEYDGDGNYRKLWVTKNIRKITKEQTEKTRKYFCPQSYLESVNNGDTVEQKIHILTRSDKVLFNILNKINKTIFYLDDVYKFEGEFKKEYPGNNRVKQKLRQRLQCLRDIKLIEFVDNEGMYKKLW